MNRIAIPAIGAVIAIAAVAAQTFAQDDDLTLGQPGFYGRLELGDDYPRPETYFSEPRLVEPVAAYEDSIYLRVRPGETREWELYCHQYEACGRYVYFVIDEWYMKVYVPFHREVRDRDDPTFDEGEIDRG